MVFHVQSEPRHSERLLQTQVFVGGRCIGKTSLSYANRMCEPGFFEEHVQALLKTQHRQVVDAAREGRIHEVLREGEPPPRPEAQAFAPDVTMAPEPAPPPQALGIEWTNRSSVYASGAVQMQVKVTRGDSSSSGASVVSRFAAPDAQANYTHAVTDADGCATLQLPATEPDLPGATVVIQASVDGSCITKKFRLKRA